MLDAIHLNDLGNGHRGVIVVHHPLRSTSRRSALGGKRTSVEVTNITPAGFSLSIGERRLSLRLEDFPCFDGASSDEPRDVELLHDEHLYWPRLDVDLAVDSIEHPERYPLKSRRSLSDGSRK